MSVLKAELTSDDFEILIEAMDDWEMIGNHEFHVMSAVKNAPMPPEDMEEHYEAMARLKEVFRKREKEIKETRQVRQERAILTKARLVMIKQDLAIGNLFNAASCPPPTQADKASSETCCAESAEATSPTCELQAKLDIAEDFIRDLGVWGHYEKFISDKTGSGDSVERTD